METITIVLVDGKVTKHMKATETLVINAPSTLPLQAQFVAVWMYDNTIWSATFRWNANNVLQRFNSENNDWEKIIDLSWLSNLNPTFITTLP